MPRQSQNRTPQPRGSHSPFTRPQKRLSLANRSQSSPLFSGALHFFSHFSPEDFDLIEEPTYETEHLERFTHPFALDETLSETHLLPKSDKLQALILKPTLVGGMTACQKIIRTAQERGIRTIFSSSFESPIGLANIAALATPLDTFLNL